MAYTQIVLAIMQIYNYSHDIQYNSNYKFSATNFLRRNRSRVQSHHRFAVSGLAAPNPFTGRFASNCFFGRCASTDSEPAIYSPAGFARPIVHIGRYASADSATVIFFPGRIAFNCFIGRYASADSEPAIYSPAGFAVQCWLRVCRSLRGECK